MARALTCVVYINRPESGLSKFEDILAGIGSHLEDADYFYFIDGDIRFNEDVLLADVSGDLVGVEHPMYPRHATTITLHPIAHACFLYRACTSTL